MNKDQCTGLKADRFLSFIEQSADWMWEVNAKGFYTYSSPRVEKMLGYAPEEIVGRTPFDLMPSEEGDRFREVFDKHIAEDKPLVMLEKIHLHKEGYPVVLEMNGVPFHDREGRICGYRGIDRDITTRKQAETTLARQKAFYEEILQNTREGIWVTDAEDRIIFFNRGMEELSGVAFSDLVGRHIFNDLPEETICHFRPFYQQARVSLTPTKYEAKVVTLAGRTAVRSGWIVPRFRNGCYSGMIFTVEDATARMEAEEALRASEERYRLAQRLSGVGSWEWDVETDNVQWSDEVNAMFGFKPNVFNGSNRIVERRIHPDDLAMVKENVRVCLEDGKSYSSEYRIVRPDGAMRWILDAGDVQRDANGRAVRMLGLVMDITERKQVEAELRQITAQRQLALDAACLGWWQYDPVSRIAKWDDGYRRIFGVKGYSRLNDEILRQIIHPEDLPSHLAKVEAALNPADPQPYVAHYRINRPDGQLRWIEAHGAATFEGEGDRRRAVEFVGTVADITGRKKVELALRKSEERFRSLFKQMPLTCELWDDRGTILQVNPAFEKMYQISAETICGKWNAFESKAIEAEGWLPIIQRAYAGETVTVPEKEHDVAKEGLKEPGRKRWTSSVFYPLKNDDGKVVNLVVIHQDITERRHQEAEREEMRRKMEQTQRLESLGVLAGGIAHDFNNILAAILGYAELAIDEISPFSPARESLAEITIASKRAADLCGQMLAYAGQGRLEMRNISLRELIEGLLHMLRTCISKKAVLKMNLDKAMLSMHGDPSQVRQILMNLVINASEAIGDSNGVITISTGVMKCSKAYLAKSDIVASAKPGTYVYIEVSDTGSGMDKKTIKSIFEPFFTTKFTGRGLGLSAVMGIVKAHKGALRVCSEIGKGTTFKMLYPSVDVPGRRSTVDVRSDGWRGSGTILLVDDEESIRAVGSERLRRLGFKVLTAEDGRQAVESYRKRRKEIDLILLDLTMPHLSGEEAFRELRRIDPEVRIILASGYSENEVASRFAGKSLAGFLQKPYSMAKLRTLLSTLLPEAKASENTEKSAALDKAGEKIT